MLPRLAPVIRFQATRQTLAHGKSMHSFTKIQLPTKRLSLRPLRASDAQAIFELFTDPDVLRYWGTPWTSIDSADDFIAKESEAMSTGKHVRLGIELKESGKLIGVCNLFNLSASSRRAEVGYCLAKTAWRQGYITESLTALLDYGFQVLDLNRVEADIDPRNVASAKSVEAQGFVQEGYLPERWILNGEFSDSLMYGLLRSRWKPATSVAS